MAKDIAFVMPYFGNFKPSFSLWLESVRRNPEIDWYIFTDNAIPDDLPQNVHWRQTTLQDVERLAGEKLGCEVSIAKPYKLCDLKPLYGAIFSDFVSDYAYWGYGDIDVIYGDLTGFLNRIDYRKYDKVNRWGHCTLIKNNDAMNRLPFTEESLRTFNTYDMLKDGEHNYCFDEVYHNKMCWNANAGIYVECFSADIDMFYERMRCVDRRTMVNFCKVENVTFAPVNYSHQVFLSDRGRTVRLYLKGKRILREEFAYIHYRQEAPIELTDQKTDTFVISRFGFFDCDAERLGDYDYVNELIKQYNAQTVMATERLTGTEFGKKLTSWYKDNDFLKRIWRKIKG